MAQYDYDLIVIGGGSGGMATAKRAAKHGAKVALFDFVTPSTQGTKWGLGGTCVNVGCVPKKLMHFAAHFGQRLHHDAAAFGWNIEKANHDWDKLRTTVQNHVRSLNFAYRGGLRSNQVTYVNAFARFSAPHEVEYELRGETLKATAKHFVVSVGGRPNIPDDVPGAREHAISSDDIFSLRNAPGKTLCVGGSYIALECAGFLSELGYDTTVAIRSIPLRGFDRQCAEKVVAMMEELGTRVRYAVVPTEIVKKDNGKLEVTFKDFNTNEILADKEEYDTVLFATGRHAVTKGINLPAAGVHVLPNGKLECVNEQTNVEHVFAVGDVLEGRPELTPVAIQAGELLADRLYNGKTEFMDYDNVPTTVFTPFEYGCCGLSEEEAIKRHGEDNVETFLFEFMSLELGAVHRHKHESKRQSEEDMEMSPPNLSKLVCLKNEGLRVVGFHYVGHNAGEVTQGFALAVRLGAKKSDFDKLVGIHPTDAESFTAMEVTRRSGESWVASGLCGGGKCG